MSSYAGVYLHGVEIFSWRNEIDPTFLFLFTREDMYRSLVDAGGFDEHEAVQLTAAASVLRDRLEVLGIGQAALNTVFDARVKEKLHILRSLSVAADIVRPEVELLEKLTLADWADLLVEALKSPHKSEGNTRLDPTSVESLLGIFEYADPRFLLGAVLLACGTDDAVTLDVTDLIEGGWIDSDSDPQSVALEEFSYSLANGNPPVVITEGSTDAQFLQAAIRVRYPHLRSYIKFLDFADGAEGSAAAGVRTLKSFAAAGISNRVVLLLDNDTAARDAVRALRGAKLPDHYSVLHYPDIQLARNYPTLGPSGLAEMDVNGLAGSIEMYLGSDVLVGADGELSPVQWRSYIEGVKAYQGEVMHKTEIQRRFREKARLAETDPEQVSAQDWSGLDAIIASLIELLSTPPGGHSHA